MNVTETNSKLWLLGNFFLDDCFTYGYEQFSLYDKVIQSIDIAFDVDNVNINITGDRRPWQYQHPIFIKGHFIAMYGTDEQ